VTTIVKTAANKPLVHCRPSCEYAVLDFGSTCNIKCGILQYPTLDTEYVAHTYDFSECHVTAFQPISKAAFGWSYESLMYYSAHRHIFSTQRI